MCSLGGLIFRDNKNLEKKKEIIKNLLIYMQERGREATGIAMINTEEDKVDILKGAISSDDFIKDEKFNNKLNEKIEESNLILLHTRQPTQGNKENNSNNHPIYNKAFNSVMVHNGIIRNDDEVKKKFNLECDGEVDSEVILAMYNKFKDMNKIYTELEGSFAFALYHSKSLYLFKYSNPIVMAYLPELDIIIFASTKEMIEKSLSTREEYLDGLFSERKLMYKAIIKEMSNHTYIRFDFNGNKFEYEISGLHLLEKKKKKNKWGLEGYTDKNKDKPLSYLEALREDDEEDIDEEAEMLWMHEICYSCGMKNYQCMCDGLDDEDEDLPLRKFNKASWTDRNGLVCNDCNLPYGHCQCHRGNLYC